MTLRSILLAGTVLPLAFAAPAFGAQKAPLLQLAQAECPEGQECPPAAEPEAQAPAAEEPPPPPAEEPAPPPAEEPAPPPPVEEAAPPPPVEEVAPPVAEEPAPPPPPVEEAAPPPPVEEAAPPPPPVEDAAPPAEEPAQQMEQQAPAAEPEQPAAEAPAAEPEVTPVPEQPAPEAEQAAPEAEQPAGAPAEPQGEAPAQDDAVQRALERQRQLQGGETPPAAEGEAPAAEPTPAAAGEAPAAETPAAEAELPPPPPPVEESAPLPPPPPPVVVEAAPPPPVEQQTTVEQQLEAQGDTQQAGEVRTLRDRLQQQLQIFAPADEDLADGGERRRRDRDRNRGDRDRDDDWGWDRRYDEDNVRDRRGDRIIIDLGGGNIYIDSTIPDEGDRLLYGADNVEVQNLRGGRTRTIVYRENGTMIVTVRDRYGEIIRRTRVLPDGREIVLIDNRFDEDDDREAGYWILTDVPPPVVSIPQNQYIVDYGNSSYDDVRGALLAPPVQQVQRAYTLDEVLRNEEVRAYSPRIDLDTITFQTGSATIATNQMQTLSELGQAMEDVIKENPSEVYLIEGHTDAVGSADSNLILSDQRAQSVATALSQNFDIPPENLVTQGYGEEYLKVNTEGAEPSNRRATVRRLTELLQAQAQ